VVRGVTGLATMSVRGGVQRQTGLANLQQRRHVACTERPSVSRAILSIGFRARRVIVAAGARHQSGIVNRRARAVRSFCHTKNSDT